METTSFNSLSNETSIGSERNVSESFVDEALVFSVLERGAYERTAVKSEEMALSSCEDDYAGRALPFLSFYPDATHHADTVEIATPVSATEISQSAVPFLKSVRATEFPEPSFAKSHAESSNFWLIGIFGVLGATLCAILSLIVLNFVQRGQPAAGSQAVPAQSQPPAELVETPPAIEPMLTPAIPGE